MYGEGAAEVRAFPDIDLVVEPGSLVAVMGPSGSGSPTRPIAIPTTCRAASVSEWPSPGRSSASAICSWLTSRPSALDSVNGEAVMRLLRAVCQQGVAGAVVTHDAQLASRADRIVFLRDGRIVDQTAPRPGPESLIERGRTR